MAIDLKSDYQGTIGLGPGSSLFRSNFIR